MTVVLITIIVSGILLTGSALLWTFCVLVGTQLVMSARYLTIWRSDQTTAQRSLVFATAPLAAVWPMLVLRPLRRFAMLTVGSVSWGTRTQIEVAAKSLPQPHE